MHDNEGFPEMVKDLLDELPEEIVPLEPQDADGNIPEAEIPGDQSEEATGNEPDDAAAIEETPVTKPGDVVQHDEDQGDANSADEAVPKRKKKVRYVTVDYVLAQGHFLKVIRRSL
jgi:hypothetical protein